jgi:hypothetical protein
MNTANISNALAALFSELTDGAPNGGYILNRGDEGLLRSLDKLTAADASAPTVTGSSIAAHVDHLRFGFALMKRWSDGEENPFKEADGSASWRKTTVSESEWKQLRADLRRESASWLDVLRTAREANDSDVQLLVSSIVHLAYHFGAIRQLNGAAAGPREGTPG